MKFLLMQGVGDSVWALHKVQAVRDRFDPGGRIDLALAGSPKSVLESRALDFVRRFGFVSSAEMRTFNIHATPWLSAEGRYNYIEDGWYDFDGERYCVLMPNGPLERGMRLEAWLPQYSINWNIFDHFRLSDAERLFGLPLRERLGDYAVFYLGPLHGNIDNGHNRNALWGPADWLELGRRVQRELSLGIVVVGASYDSTYFELFVRPSLNGDAPAWVNLIGRTSIGELFGAILRARFIISYQAGVGIVSTYLGRPTGIFWRMEGDSISPNEYLSFDERMASAWVPPARLADGTHLPLYYGRHGVDYVMDEIRQRGWAR